MKQAKKKRKYYRKCGVCGERGEQSEMITDNNSLSSWICEDCYDEKHADYEIEEF